MKMRTIKGLLLIIILLAIIASITGIIYPDLYYRLVAVEAIAASLADGAIAQDMATLILSLLFLLMLGFKMDKLLRHGLLFGALGYYLYAYGLYSIQGQYTYLYPLHLAIFSLSIYGLLLGIIQVASSQEDKVEVSRRVELLTAFFFMLVVFILGPAWLAMMSKDIGRGLPSPTYGVFVFDLALVFPGMLITVVRLIGKKGHSILLAISFLVKTFTLCFSWSLAEWLASASSNFMRGMSTSLAILALLLFLNYAYLIRKKGAVT